MINRVRRKTSRGTAVLGTPGPSLSIFSFRVHLYISTRISGRGWGGGPTRPREKGHQRREFPGLVARSPI